MSNFPVIPPGIPGLPELLTVLAEGDLRRAPRQVLLDLETIDESQFTALMEWAKHRSFGHRILGREDLRDSAEGIQRLRAYVNNGEFERVLTSASPSDAPDPETLLETARSRFFLAEYEEAARLARALADRKDTPLVTRGVGLQVLGMAELELDRVESRATLEEALRIAGVVRNSAGTLAARLSLAKLHALTEEHERASIELGAARRVLFGEVQNFRWVLGFLRMRAHLEALAGRAESEAHALSWAGAHLAHAVGDEIHVARGLLELSVLQKCAGQKPAFGTIAWITELCQRVAAARGAGLADWIAWLENPGHRANSSRTLRRFSELPRREQKSLPTAMLTQRTPGSLGWIHDRESALLVDLTEAGLHRLPPTGPQARLLAALSGSDGPMPLDAAFEAVWKIRWNSTRHRNTLEVTVHRLSKISPSLRVSREDGTLRLVRPGIAIGS